MAEHPAVALDLLIGHHLVGQMNSDFENQIHRHFAVHLCFLDQNRLDLCFLDC